MIVRGTIEYNPKILHRDHIKNQVQELHLNDAIELWYEYVADHDVATRNFTRNLKGKEWTWKSIENFFGFLSTLRTIPEVNQFFLNMQLDLHQAPGKFGWGIVRLWDEHCIAHWSQARRLADGARLSRPAFGPHVTFSRGELTNTTLLDNHKTIEIYLPPNVQQRGRSFYVDVSSKELEQLRVKLGLPPRPKPDFHMTIGSLSP